MKLLGDVSKAKTPGNAAALWLGHQLLKINSELDASVLSEFVERLSSELDSRVKKRRRCIDRNTPTKEAITVGLGFGPDGILTVIANKAGLTVGCWPSNVHIRLEEHHVTVAVGLGAEDKSIWKADLEEMLAHFRP